MADLLAITTSEGVAVGGALLLCQENRFGANRTVHDVPRTHRGGQRDPDDLRSGQGRGLGEPTATV